MLKSARGWPLALLVACGPGPSGSGEPYAQPPDDSGGAQQPAADVSPAERIASARRMTPAPPDTPAQHFYADGTVTFLLEEQAEPIVQELNVAQAGAALQRITLRAGGRRNVFLLSGPEHAWVLEAGKTGWEAQDPREQSVDAWARWTLLRLPWDMRPALDGATGEPGEQGNGLWLSLEGPYGPFRLRLDARGLPAELRMDETRVELEDWRPADRSPVLFPYRWKWHKPWGEMIEEFRSLRADFLLLDAFFRKPGEPGSGVGPLQLIQIGQTQLDSPRDELGLVEREPLRCFTAPEAVGWRERIAAAGLSEEPVWLLLPADGPRRVALLLQAGDLHPTPEGFRLEEVPAGTCFRWATRQRITPEEAAAQLREWAAANALEAVGPLWSSRFEGKEGPVYWEFLLPVRPRPADD